MRDYALYLKDILEAMEAIEKFVEDVDRTLVDQITSIKPKIFLNPSLALSSQRSYEIEPVF